MRLQQLLQELSIDEDRADTPISLYRTYLNLDNVTHCRGTPRLTHGGAGIGTRTVSVFISAATQKLLMTIQEDVDPAPADPESSLQIVPSYYFCMHPLNVSEPDHLSNCASQYLIQ